MSACRGEQISNIANVLMAMSQYITLQKPFGVSSTLFSDICDLIVLGRHL
jgi:hypothetical protein